MRNIIIFCLEVKVCSCLKGTLIFVVHHSLLFVQNNHLVLRARQVKVHVTPRCFSHLCLLHPSSSKSFVTLCISLILVALLRILTLSEQDNEELEQVPSDQNRLPITRIA